MNAHDRSAECLSPFALDAWNAGDLQGEEARRCAAHLDSCTRCRAELDDVRQSSEAYLERFPSFAGLAATAPRRPEQAATATLRRLPPRASLGRVGYGAIFASVAMAAAALLMLRPNALQQVETTQTKGRPHLNVFVQRAGHTRLLTSTDSVSPSERLVFTVSHTEPHYVALLGDDGSGLTRYEPQPGAPVELIAAGRNVPLEHALELDAQGDHELYMGVFCDDAQTVLAAERDLLAGQSAESSARAHGCSIDSIRLKKVAAPRDRQP